MSDQPPAPPPSFTGDDENKAFNDWLKKRSAERLSSNTSSEPSDSAASREFSRMMQQKAASPPTPPEPQIPVAPVSESDLDNALRSLAQSKPVEPAPPPKIAQPLDLDEEDEAYEDSLDDEDDEFAYVGTGSDAPKVKRRRARRTMRGTLGVIGGFIRSIVIVTVAAGLTATIFIWFMPNDFINSRVRAELSSALLTEAVTREPTVQATPNWARRIGIVSGHRGPQNDPGAVCPDGLTEAEINFNVAQMVVAALQQRGYTVDLLDEFDPRLDMYQASALVSIHANTCQDFGELVTGFLIAAAAARVTARGDDEFLVNCIAENYQINSGLERRMGLTVDMTDYHTFREIHPRTPAVIIELGFMLADRQIMTERPDALAKGITDGVLCYLEPGIAPPPSITATPATAGA
jgi:N-acetylmuramoyl-L-alanine amidase